MQTGYSSCLEKLHSEKLRGIEITEGATSTSTLLSTAGGALASTANSTSSSFEAGTGIAISSAGTAAASGWVAIAAAAISTTGAGIMLSARDRYELLNVKRILEQAHLGAGLDLENISKDIRRGANKTPAELSDLVIADQIMDLDQMEEICKEENGEIKFASVTRITNLLIENAH